MVSQCYDGQVLNRGSSCTVQCDVSAGYEPTVSTLTCSSNAAQDDPVVIPSCIGMPCNIIVPTNGALGSCTSSLSSGSTCTPTCNDGFVQQGGILQISCLRGVIQSNVVCEAVPDEEENTFVLAPFVIPMTVVSVEDSSGDNDDDDDDDGACNPPTIDSSSETALKSTVSSFVGVNPSDVQSLYYSCEATSSQRRRMSSSQPEYFLHFTIKLKSDGVVETVQRTIENVTQPSENGTTSPFLEAYDEYIVNTLGPTWEMFVLTDSEGDVLLDLDHVREVGVSMSQLELVHTAFNNHTNQVTGVTFLPEANSVYCAKFYDSVLWFLTGHERVSPQDPLPNDLRRICNESNQDSIVEISAVVDVQAAESEETTRTDGSEDVVSSGGVDTSLIIITTIICGTIFVVSSSGFFVYVCLCLSVKFYLFISLSLHPSYTHEHTQ
jgi:hypothetical protein